MVVSNDGLGSLVEEQLMVSLPCCEVQIAGEDYQQMYKSLQDLTKCKERVNKQDILKELANHCTRYSDPTQKKLIETNSQSLAEFYG